MRFDCVIRNGKIWDGENLFSELQDVAIKDGKIAVIGNVVDETELLFDAKGGIVSCGFVDIHMHMKGCCSDIFGIPAEIASFPFGVTTAVEAWADKDGGVVLDNLLLDAFVFVGVNVVKNHADLKNTEKLLSVYKNRAIGLKICFDRSNLAVVDETPLKEVCAYAQEKKLKVLVHTTGTPVPMQRVLEILNKGDICSHIFHGGEFTVADDDYVCLSYAKQKGIVLDNAMAGGVHTDFAVAKGAIEAGLLSDTISTDITRLSAFKRGGNYGMTMCISIMRELGVAENELFKAITGSAAKSIGIEKIAGKLEVGRKADIAVIRYEHSPFKISDKWGNCVQSDYGYKNLLTIKNGNVVFRTNI